MKEGRKGKSLLVLTHNQLTATRTKGNTLLARSQRLYYLAVFLTTR